ncbi:hypothetical protein CSC37_1965 [Escherichia coli]|nr:hypothetical protein CSC37_1965 [Escherichia coli]
MHAFTTYYSNPDGFEIQLAALKEVALQMVFSVMTACSDLFK